VTATRRLAVLDGARRTDLIVPLFATVADALNHLGIDPSDNALALDETGRTTEPTTPIRDLPDGALITVVDPTQEPPEPARRRTPAVHRDTTRTALWWTIGVLGAVAATTALLRPAASTPHALIFGALALGTLVVAARQTAQYSTATLMTGPILLTAAAALYTTPVAIPGATQVSIAATTGAIAGALLIGLLAAKRSQTRAVLGVLASYALLLTGLWLAIVMLGWSTQVGAALTVGLTPLMVRALPSTLLQFPQGEFVDYGRFLRNPWSVRGTITGSTASVDPKRIRERVQESSTARATGTVTLALTGGAFLPFATPADPPSTLVTVGSAALVTCYVLASALIVRHEPYASVRWSMRASAFIGLIVGMQLLADGTSAPWILAVTLVTTGLIAVAFVAPISRGTTSLTLSRAGDIFQGLAVVLSLPAALIASNGIELVRRTVSG
jgi:hypothetical protein